MFFKKRISDSGAAAVIAVQECHPSLTESDELFQKMCIPS